jgi:hypothetical protein
VWGCSLFTLSSKDPRAKAKGGPEKLKLGKPGTLTIKCLKIEKNSVLITVEGEDTPRLLHLR